MDRKLESRIARLEKLIMNEDVELPANTDDLIDQMTEMNKSNRLDTDNLRWASAVNLLSKMNDVAANGDTKAKFRVEKDASKMGFTSAAALVMAMSASVNSHIAKLKEVQAGLKDFYKAAKKFDNEVEDLEAELLTQDQIRDKVALIEVNNMDKKLEYRISKLERLLKVNEVHDRDELGLKAMNAVESLSKASDLVSQIAIALDYDGNPQAQEWQSIEDKLNDIIVKVNKLGFKLQ